MRKLLSLAVLLLALSAMQAYAADSGREIGIAPPSGLPIPRFASLRSGEVNLRAGPGTRYPIDWVLTRKELPVEIIAEYDVWRRVRDIDGDEGWVHKSELTGKRFALVTGGPHALRDSDNDAAAVLANLETGARGQLLACGPVWCKLKFDDVKGYLHKSDFWGAYGSEIFR